MVLDRFFVQKTRRHLKLRFKLLLMIIVAGAVLMAHDPLFEALYAYLTLKQEPAPADALVVEGWVFDSGKRHARDLYTRGFGRTIFTTGGPILRNASCHHWGTWAEAARSELLSSGIAASEVIPIPTPLRGTRQAALALRPYLVERGISSMIIVTQKGHERRSYLAFRKALEDLKVSVFVTAAEEDWFRSDNWWKSHDGLIFLFTEYLSLLYYWFNNYI